MKRGTRNYYIPQKFREQSEQYDDSNGFAAIIEEDEDDLTTRENSPVFVEMTAGDLDVLGEKRDTETIPVMPWRGLLKKANSKVNLNE